VSTWRATKAKRVYAALLRIGWTLKKQVGSHRKLQRAGWPNFTFCFHDSEEVGPAALSKIGKDTGLRPEDLLIRSDPPLSSDWADCLETPHFLVQQQA